MPTALQRTKLSRPRKKAPPVKTLSPVDIYSKILTKADQMIRQLNADYTKKKLHHYNLSDQTAKLKSLLNEATDEVAHAILCQCPEKSATLGIRLKELSDTIGKKSDDDE
jgi:hypothetical protein